MSLELIYSVMYLAKFQWTVSHTGARQSRSVSIVASAKTKSWQSHKAIQNSKNLSILSALSQLADSRWSCCMESIVCHILHPAPPPPPPPPPSRQGLDPYCLLLQNVLKALLQLSKTICCSFFRLPEINLIFHLKKLHVVRQFPCIPLPDLHTLYKP